MNIQEIDQLNQLVPRGKPISYTWEEIAKHFPGRTAKQCRERCLQHPKDGRKKGGWTAAEDSMLSKMHKEHGNKWALIASKMSRRMDNDVKVRGDAILGGECLYSNYLLKVICSSLILNLIRTVGGLNSALANEWRQGTNRSVHR